MIIESRPSKSVASSLVAYRDMTNDSGYRVKGEIFYHLSDPDNRTDIYEHLLNIVTLDAGILIARLVKDPTEPGHGIYALAVGTGDANWPPVPSATVTQRSLYNEIARKSASSTQFIDSSGNPSTYPTNIVDFMFTFGPGEAVGPLTEMGLLGGDVAVSSRNPVLPPNGTYNVPPVDLVGKDTLCNYLTFPVINKSVTATLQWTWRLTF